MESRGLFSAYNMFRMCSMGRRHDTRQNINGVGPIGIIYLASNFDSLLVF